MPLPCVAKIKPSSTSAKAYTTRPSFLGYIFAVCLFSFNVNSPFWVAMYQRLLLLFICLTMPRAVSASHMYFPHLPACLLKRNIVFSAPPRYPSLYLKKHRMAPVPGPKKGISVFPVVVLYVTSPASFSIPHSRLCLSSTAAEYTRFGETSFTPWPSYR